MLSISKIEFKILSRLLLGGFFVFISQGLKAQDTLFLNEVQNIEEVSSSKFRSKAVKIIHKVSNGNEKLEASLLAITLGAFGVHRLYLGTKPVVPVFYCLTLGGGFYILTLIDVGVIVFSKDLEKYKDNDKIVMWL
jgi:TM2 domain-containing membrane protein YozV